MTGLGGDSGPDGATAADAPTDLPTLFPDPWSGAGAVSGATDDAAEAGSATDGPHISNDTPGDSGSDPTERPAKETQPKSRLKSTVEWVAVIAVALIVALGVRQWVFQPFWIPSGSMESTLDIGDRVLVNKMSYHLHSVRRGDVVVFRQPRTWPLAASVKDLIKRVIAVPGDSVYIHDCSVWLNGARLSEPYTHGKCTDPAEAVIDPDGDGRFVVPANMLFVMGDNRTGSTDSRYNGFVPKGDVVGRAFVIIWPRKHWGWL